MKDWLNKLLLLVITAAALGLVGIALDDYLHNNDVNDCTMTYMYQDPGLIHVKLPIDGTGPFEYYKLYLYCEGQECADAKKKNVTFLPGHIPVLYVPGNGDSPLQVRSLASVALDKTRQLRYQRSGKLTDEIKFQFFTIDFQKELTGLYGPFLEIQTEYVKYCVNFIMALFDGIEPEEKRPTSVVLIGNSMGGAVARGIFLPSQMSITPTSTKKKTGSEMKKSKKNKEKVPVHTVITKSTPHKRPVVNFDEDMNDFYARVNDYWLNVNESSLENVMLVSLFGGHRDTMVRSELANLNDWRDQTSAGIVSAHTVSVPYVWKSIDHKCMAWCKELVLQIVRSLFDMVDVQTSQITNDRAKREAILRHYFEKDAPIDQEKAELTAKMAQVDDLSLSQSEQRAIKEIARRHRVINSDTLQQADYNKINFDFNSFAPSNATIHFELAKVLKTKAYDSLFVYTNIPDAYSLIMCKSLDKLGAGGSGGEPSCAPPAEDEDGEGMCTAPPAKATTKTQSGYNCTDYLDLFRAYGRTIAATEHQKANPIRIINVHDLQKLVNTDGYTSLLLTLPKKEKVPGVHQIVVNFDWYVKSERTAELNDMPGLLSPSVSLDLATLFKPVTNSADKPVTYRRVYLPKFNSILQAYELVKKASKAKASELATVKKAHAHEILCDDYLKIELEVRKSTGTGFPLALSTMFILFTEQVDRSTQYVYNSQASLLSPKVLKLRLSANVEETTAVPYLEFIQFNIEHLLNHVSIKEKVKKNALSLVKACRTHEDPVRSENDPKKDLIQLQVAYPSILAQFLRHYCVLILAFLVLIIQSYDIVNLTKAKQMSSDELDKYKSKLILYKYNVLFRHHLALSSLVTVLAYAVQSGVFAKLVATVDPYRSFIPLNDFELLKAEKLYNVLVPFVIYWCAFGLINLASVILSNKLQTATFIVHKIFAKLLDFSNEKLVKKISSLHVMGCIFSNSQGSPLSQAILVVGELIRLAFLNPNYYTNLDGTSSVINEYVNYSNDVTRFVFYIILLALNAPSVVVWFNFVRIDSFGALTTFIDDIGATFSILTLGLNLFAYFRRSNRLDMLAVENKYLIKLVSLNAFLTVLYSSVNLYRLPYFILIHIFLMCFYNHKQPFELTDNKSAAAKAEKSD